MKISFNKKIAAYVFGGLVVFIFATLFFLYNQLRDVDNFKNLVVEKIGGPLSVHPRRAVRTRTNGRDLRS